MSPTLPPKPSLRHLSEQAKDLVKRHGRGDAGVCATLRRLRRFVGAGDADILSADVALHDAQFALAMDYGFGSWAELKAHVAGRRQTRGLLHVHCGDSVAGSHRQSSLHGQVIVWQDPLLEGPTPAHVSGDAWMRVRAAHHVGAGHAKDIDANLNWQRQQEDALAAFVDCDEVVLWFDACLFDHAIMIRHLDWFGRQGMGHTTLSLICCGEFPGRDAYRGLGELRPDELASLFGSRRPVTPAQAALGTRAWAAYRSPDPTAIEDLLAGDTSALPYLDAALTRHLERFPAVHSGLCRLENEVLSILGGEPHGFGEIFERLSAMDHPPFFGDGHVSGVLDRLGSGAHPMVVVADDADRPSKRTYAITDTGRDALAGRADAVALNGIDRWLGGVHLDGPAAPWRWDASAGALVRG